MREMPIPTPKAGEVRIKVKANGVCHSDVASKYNSYNLPDFYPHIPGHEVVGVIESLGADVKGFKVGDRVGAGWFGGCCHQCHNCVKKNAWLGCQNSFHVTSISSQGGYAEFMVSREDALVRIPDGMSDEDAAPLLCAGITSFNALRNSKARPPDLVAVVGMGGLGHLGVQYAAKMGFNVVALSRGSEKKEMALKLGARHYIQTDTQNAVEELKKLGGAAVIMDTAGNAKMIAELIGGLAFDGQLIVDAVVSEPVSISMLALLRQRGSITAWGSGDSRDSQDTVDFSHYHGVKSMNEIFQFKDANAAFDRMLSTKAQFRVVLKM